jgi:hypothetical protein
LHSLSGYDKKRFRTKRIHIVKEYNHLVTAIKERVILSEKLDLDIDSKINKK